MSGARCVGPSLSCYDGDYAHLVPVLNRLSWFYPWLTTAREMDRLMPDAIKDLKDLQAFQRWIDDLKGFPGDIYFSLVRLVEEVGEVAGVMKQIHRRAWALEQETGHDRALATAIKEHREVLGGELSDCIAFISKIANAADLDLQQAYVSKMTENVRRDYGFPTAVTRGNRE